MPRLRIAALSAVMALASFSAGMLFQVCAEHQAAHCQGAAPRDDAVIVGGKARRLHQGVMAAGRTGDEIVLPAGLP